MLFQIIPICILGYETVSYTHLDVYKRQALGRELWNVVDVIVAILLLVSILIKSKRHDNKPDIEVSKPKKDKT